MKLMCQPANKKQTSLRRVLRPGTFRPLHVLALLLLIPSFSSAAVTISNLAVAQRPGTKLVDITYSVSNPDTPSVIVTLAISNAGEPINATSLTGAIGTGVQTGAGKSIVWNMADDWDGNVAQLLYTLSAVPEMPVGGDPAAEYWVLVNPRWVKNIYSNGHITMSDRISRMMYLYDANYLGYAPHYNAKPLCWNLFYAHYIHWSLPSKDQLYFLYTQKGFFINVQDTCYWSSNILWSGDAYATAVSMVDGTYYELGVHLYYAIWPCRQQ